MDLGGILQRYHSRLIALERRAPLTAAAYEYEIRRFLDWLDREALEIQDLVTQDLTRYLETRRDIDKLDARSIAKAVSSLRSFFRFACDESIRTDNPAELLQAPKKRYRIPQHIPRDRVEQLLSAIDTNTVLGIRDRALFEFIYSAGLRVSEAVALNLDDVFLSEGIARITGKGSKERLVPFGGESLYWLCRYLNESRPSLLKARHSRAFFLNRSGKRLSRKGMWKKYAAAASDQSLPSKLHNLRHSYASELLAGGADLRSVQELLGHADLGTTQIYTHVDTSLLREQHRRYIPRLRGYTE